MILGRFDLSPRVACAGQEIRGSENGPLLPDFRTGSVDPMNETVEHIVTVPSERRHDTPLFFQHGAWHGAFCWEDFMGYFASLGYEVHAVSLPGHGGSSLSRQNVNRYSVRDYVDCLGAEIEKVSPRPVLVGHSMGGFLTLRYLESHPLPAAVLVASVPHGGVLPFMGRMFRRHFRASVRMFATNHCVMATPEMARDMFLSADTGIDLEAFHGRLCAESMWVAMELTFRPGARPERVTSPTFVLAAERDACFSIREQEGLAKVLNAKYELLTGTAHNIMMEPKWREAADRIDAWITKDLGLP